MLNYWVRTIMTIIAICVFYQPVFSQKKAGVVNISEIKEKIYARYSLGELLESANDSLYAIRATLVEKFKKMERNFLMMKGCGTPADHQKQIARLTAEHEKLVLFEETIKDTLNFWKNDLESKVRGFVVDQIQLYGRQNNVQLIVDTKVLRYYSKEVDYTDTIYMLVLASENVLKTMVDSYRLNINNYIKEVQSEIK